MVVLDQKLVGEVMRWPWRIINVADKRRGTLDLFDDRWIVGLPHDTTQESGHRLAESLNRAWPNLPRVCVFNVPLDVTDHRTKHGT